MRNKAEKQRRDKLNNYITELATLVPTVASSSKRLDKTSILRLSANYLRTARCSVMNPSDSTDREAGRFNNHLSEVLQNLEGFLLVAHGTGKILFVTENVEKLLGHSQNEMLGHLLFSFAAPEQHAELRRQLTPDGQPTPAPCASSAVSPGGASGDDSMSSADSASSVLSSPPPAATPSAGAASLSTQPSPTGSAGSPAPATAAAVAAAVVVAGTSGGEGGTSPQRQRRSFVLNLSQRAVSRGDAAHYEPFSVVGYLHVPGRPPTPAGPRGHGRRPPEPPAPSANDIVLVAVVQQHKERSIADFSIMEATREEYVTRHFKDGRIAYSDHRIAMVAGYLSEEVAGLSAFQFMHKDDVNFTVVALQQMYDLGEGAGGSAYRLLAKTGRYIYLRTQGFLEFNKTNGQVETLICINTLLTEDEGERLIKEMKTRFAASVAKCQRITRTGGPLAKAVSPEYITPSVMPAPERPLPSPSHLEDRHFVQANPTSDPAHSPVQGASPGSSQFASMAIHSPVPVQPQPSPPVPQYTGVITGPSSASSHMERPTVLRQTQSVITERVSVLTTAGNPSVSPMDSGDVSEKSRWEFKEVSVLKRASSLDGNGSSSKRLHTGSQPRLRRRDSQPPSLTEALEVEVSHCPPVLTPEEQHQALLARRAQPSATVPSPAYRGQWPSAHGPSSHSPLPDSSSFVPPYISPGPLTDQDQSLEDLENLCDESFLSNFEAESIPLQSLPDPSDWPSFADGLGVPTSHAISLTASGVDLDQSSAVQYSSVEHHLQIQHQVLQTRMKYQETQMNQLEQSLDTVPVSDQTLQNSLSHLKDQHKKQLQMLHTLKQDHHCLQRQDTLGTGPCVKQNLGV